MVPVVAGSSPVRHLYFHREWAPVSFGRALQVTRILALVLAGIYAVAALGGLLADFVTPCSGSASSAAAQP